MYTYGLFKVCVIVVGADQRVRRVTLFRAHCERTECSDLYTQLLERNPHLDKNDLDATFVPETVAIHV